MALLSLPAPPAELLRQAKHDNTATQIAELREYLLDYLQETCRVADAVFSLDD